MLELVAQCDLKKQYDANMAAANSGDASWQPVGADSNLLICRRGGKPIVLGCGSFTAAPGVVLGARINASGERERVAIKQLQARDNFNDRELENLSSQRVKNGSHLLVQLVDWSIDKQFLALELGMCTLADVLDAALLKQITLSPQIVKSAATALVEAVSFLHSVCIIHRDICVSCCLFLFVYK